MIRVYDSRKWILLLLVGICLGAGSATAAEFLVDPGTSGTAVPQIIVTAEPGEQWTAFFRRLESGEPRDIISSETQTASTAPLVFHLPAVKVDTFVEAGLTTSTDPETTAAFSWRTLARPAGKAMMDYQGQRELLPPEDFDAYWKRALSELDKVTSNPRVTRQPDGDTTTGLLYRVELDSVENTTVVGWLFVPRAAHAAGNPDAEVIKKFPAIILAPGYGGEMRPVDRTKDGYITMSINPRNHGPSRSFWKSPVEHQLYNFENPNSYYYKLATLDCMQAVRFVFGRSEVDTARIGTEGSSQGGYFAVAMAALEPRIKSVVALVIAFTDYPDGMALASHGHQTRAREVLNSEETSAALVRKSLAYTDGVNLIPRVKGAIQITMGGIDPVCPYVCGVVAYNRIGKGVEKSFDVDPMTVHKVTPMMRERARDWHKRWLQPAAETPQQD